MKSLKLEYIEEADFFILAINSHSKGYKLCWEINNTMNLSFIKNEYHTIEEKKDLVFSRFTAVNTDLEIQYDLISNHSKGGYLLPKFKKIEYFLKVQNPFWEKEKREFIKKLSELAEILLIFEFDINKINSLNPFIFNDKKN